jgi:hypothetical protein
MAIGGLRIPARGEAGVIHHTQVRSPQPIHSLLEAFVPSLEISRAHKWLVGCQATRKGLALRIGSSKRLHVHVAST